MPATPLSYNILQQSITEYNSWVVIEHLLQRRSPHLGGCTYNLQKHIYDLKVIYVENLASFINKAAIFWKNNLYQQAVAPNLLFEKVLVHIMACQNFPLSFALSTLTFSIYNTSMVAL